MSIRTFRRIKIGCICLALLCFVGRYAMPLVTGDNRIGPISQLVWPHQHYCECCGTSWRLVKLHVTMYSDRIKADAIKEFKDKRIRCVWCEVKLGCAPMCDRCWEEHRPAERLRYYRQWWASMHEPLVSEWLAIEKAVLAGE